jgi:hypothetical protein
MFKQDQARIQRWCKNPDKVIQVGLVALCSIRMQWVGVGNQLAKINAGDLTPLWGHKRKGYEYLKANKKLLYRTVRDLRAGRISTRAFIRQWIKVPGMGIVKAGFVAQMTCGKAGCLDMHNIERYGLDAKVFQVPARVKLADQMQAIDDTINHYLSLCELCGGTEYLWDEWCRVLADKVSTFDGPEDVSRRHYIYLLSLPGDE